MMAYPRTFGLIALALAAVVQPQMAHAAADPAEIAFWQSVDGSKDPREYQMYLNAYPNGAFAALAKSRLAGGLPAPHPTPTGLGVAPNPAPPDDPDGPALTISPPGGRVGQLFTIGCRNLPENSNSDMIIVVRAGSPVLPPNANSEQMKILTQGYSANCKFYNNTIPNFGPYAPGDYEVRFMSTLYNDDHKYEMKAKIAFTVR
jgi:hypothetical protein